LKPPRLHFVDSADINGAMKMSASIVPIVLLSLSWLPLHA